MQVESLIKKGDTEEKSETKIKRLNVILKLLCDERKSNEGKKNKKVKLKWLQMSESQ